jgi:hypothetical protein
MGAERTLVRSTLGIAVIVMGAVAGKVITTVPEFAPLLAALPMVLLSSWVKAPTPVKVQPEAAVSVTVAVYAVLASKSPFRV